MSAITSAFIKTEIEIKNVSSERCYDHSDSMISVLDINNLEYHRFHDDYLMKNVPCLIQNVSKAWECSTNWISNNEINTTYLSNKYNTITAPVADCNTMDFNSQYKIDMTVGEYMSYLNGERKKLLYLKDWHLRRTRPNDQFYSVPFLFASDWLNEYALDKEEDDFMFVYIGPTDSWTPLHVDVYYSYSWSVNVVGQKKWILFPPGEEKKLKDSLGNLPLLFKSADYPTVKFFEVIQNKGDAIFVPSGWHHQVKNTLDTISVNHNWINGCNIQAVWSALQDSLKSVELEIKEFEDTAEYGWDCQTILKTLFGMDYATFLNFLMHIAKKRLGQLSGHKHFSFNKFTFGSNLINFDLTVISKLLGEMNSIPNFFDKFLLTEYRSDFIHLRDELLVKIKASVHHYLYSFLLHYHCYHLSPLPSAVKSDLQIRFDICIHMFIANQLSYLVTFVF